MNVDILHSIKPVTVEGAVYGPHKGEEGVTLPDKLGKAMIKKGWACTAKCSHIKVKGAELKAAAQWVKGTGNISGAKIEHTHISTYFVDATNIWGGKVVTPLVEGTKHTKVIAFDSNRLTRCLWTCKKGEEVDIQIRPSTLEITDKDGRQWIHTLPGKEEMRYIKGMKKLKTGSIRLFIEKEGLVNLKRAIAEAVKEGKADYTTYEDIVLVTEGKNVNIFLHGHGSIKKVYCVYTGDERGESVAVYPLDAFRTVLKGVKARGETEGLKLCFDEGAVLKATFGIGASVAVVYIAGKTEERREEVRKVLNPSPPSQEEEEEKEVKRELDRIQEEQEREQEKHKEEQAFKEAEEAVEKWKETFNPASTKDKVSKEVVKEGISFLTIHEATGAQFRNPKDVYEDMKAEAEIDRECMWALHLDGQNKIVLKELVAVGRGNSAQIAAREVYRRAIIEGVVSVILVHNHPSGDPAPSEGDKICCENMKKAGLLLGVPLLDFMIVAREGYTSFADKGIGGF